jgi:hypothetical protein
MTELREPLAEFFSRSKQMVLNFKHIPEDTQDNENIALYFKDMEKEGLNPRLPENRQKFNNRALELTGKRYLVSSYAEDRISMLEGSSIAKEGRTIHLGVDIFSKDLEDVLAPCDGEILRIGREVETHSFGNYLILKPNDNDLPYLFFGHLAFGVDANGEVKAGQQIASLGDYLNNENGGWSRHLHLQCFKDMPSEDEPLVGYGLASDMAEIEELYPDPMQFFPDIKL